MAVWMLFFSQVKKSTCDDWMALSSVQNKNDIKFNLFNLTRRLNASHSASTQMKTVHCVFLVVFFITKQVNRSTLIHDITQQVSDWRCTQMHLLITMRSVNFRMKSIFVFVLSNYEDVLGENKQRQPFYLDMEFS